MKQRKVPMRKCIVSNEMKPKKDLTRLVRDSEGHVAVDLTGKKNGRGAYITNDRESFLKLKDKDLLSRHLKVKVTTEDYERLIEESRGNDS
ncbi:RNase P modulator RnpM [Geomicrobium sp. JCM 19038]|uniref:RNase P modulator RnpM n=1 Tax=Geomicrobium sp. JCM 19038 TaxID=1460635 RepID=UPI00045F2712|nr:YlxR family RNase P modulator [Geomicrobium sp. JCM 19038]GAK07563.1 predicted nucleic-acid-binding protein [Geomicrobium sp. JCM 19038]